MCRDLCKHIGIKHVTYANTMLPGSCLYCAIYRGEGSAAQDGQVLPTGFYRHPSPRALLQKTQVRVHRTFVLWDNLNHNNSSVLKIVLSLPLTLTDCP